MTLTNFLNQLQSITEISERRGGREYRFPCPAHGGNDANAALYVKDDGFYCTCYSHGCTHHQIVDAVIGENRPILPTSTKRTKSTPKQYKGKPFWERQIAEIYPYCDADGRLLYQKIRFAKWGKHAPKFAIRRPHSDPDKRARGYWHWSLGEDTQRVLYNLPALSSAGVIVICEGEKDVDRLIAAGLVATTDYAGAWTNKQNPKWLSAEYNQHFALKTVYILPDNDDAGRVRAAYIAASLERTAAAVHIINLPDLPKKGDVSDWLDNGGNARALVEICRLTPRFDAGIVDLFAKSGAVDSATSTGVGQWRRGSLKITRKADKCDCGQCRGAAVVTFWENEVGVSKMNNATRHECKKRLHNDAWRITQQAWQEMKSAAVYLVQMSSADAIRWQSRNRKRTTPHRFQHIVLADGKSALLTTDDSLDGAKLPHNGDQLYDLLLPLLAESNPEKRIGSTKTKRVAVDDNKLIHTIVHVGWGESFVGMRGNGRRKIEKAIGRNATQCSQYYAKQNTAKQVANILGATWKGKTARVQMDAIMAFEMLTAAGVTLKLRSLHTDIFAVGLGANEGDLRDDSQFKDIAAIEKNSMCLNREKEPTQGGFAFGRGGIGATKTECAALSIAQIAEEIPF